MLWQVHGSTDGVISQRVHISADSELLAGSSLCRLSIPGLIEDGTSYPESAKEER